MMDRNDRCPFCCVGHAVLCKIIQDDMTTRAYAVVCENCGAVGPPAETTKGAITCWLSRMPRSEAEGMQ